MRCGVPAVALSRVGARVGRVRCRRAGSSCGGVAAAGGAARSALAARADLPAGCLVAVAVCAFTAAGNDRFTAVGQWIRRASQADLARLRAPWDPIAGRYRAPDEKTIRVVLDRLDQRALTRALLGPRPRPRRRPGGPPAASVRGYPCPARCPVGADAGPPDLRCSCRDVHSERRWSASNAAVTCDVIIRLHPPKECCSHFCCIQ